jgi:hypothetical protein
VNLTKSSEPMQDSGPTGAYKTEGPDDMMYPYQVRALNETATLISVCLKCICLVSLSANSTNTAQ